MWRGHGKEWQSLWSSVCSLWTEAVCDVCDKAFRDNINTKVHLCTLQRNSHSVISVATHLPKAIFLLIHLFWDVVTIKFCLNQTLLKPYRTLGEAGINQSVWRIDCRLDDQGSIPGKGNDGIFSLCHRVQTGSGVHPTSYPMGTGGSFIWSKATVAWIWPLTFV
jgi:hypothetical protein